MRIKPSKKLVLTITLVLVLIVLVVLIYLFLFVKPPEEKPTEEVISPEETIGKQLKGLQNLPQPLSEEEIKKQMRELEHTQPLSEEEIRKQLEELNK